MKSITRYKKTIAAAVLFGSVLYGLFLAGTYNPYNELSVLSLQRAAATTELNLEAPELETPDQLEVPELETPDSPETPTLETPELDTPELDIPELDVPELDVPELDIPDLDTPTNGGAYTCSLHANAYTIHTGGSVTISWDATGYDEIKINGEVVTDPEGRKTYTNVTNKTDFTLTATTDDGSHTCNETITISCIPPATPLQCEDFGYDFEIGRFEWEGYRYEQEDTIIGYDLSVAGDAHTADWTANPLVDGVVAKAGTAVAEFAGGTSGVVRKADIGSGQRDISHIKFCGYEIPEEPKECELEVTKEVDKTSARIGDTLTYTINVTNIGDANCTGGGIKIEDIVDTNLSFDWYTYTSNFDEGYEGADLYADSDRTLRFNGNTLTPGEGGSISWTGVVQKPAQCGDFRIDNQAKATARELDNFNTWVKSNTVSTDIDYDCDTPEQPEPPVCPYQPTEGRTIVDFADDMRLFSNRGADKAATDILSTNLTPGTYSIKLVSWDGYNSRVNVTQPLEQWVGVLYSGTSEIAVTSALSDVPDRVREATVNEEVAQQFNLSSAIDGVQARHFYIGGGKTPNSVVPICAVFDKEPEEEVEEEATVVAHKIVCEDESQLPNWGAGGPSVTDTTAADWVAANNSCSFATGWQFEWTDTQSSDPGDTVVGPAGTPWNTFGPTNSNGRTEIDIDLTDLGSERLWFREVLQSGYIPFTHGLNNQTNVDNVSAEFYCHTDVINYDNRDFIRDLQDGETYYCVAFNSPVEDAPAAQCDAFSATPGTITQGDDVVLNWETTNATRVVIDNGVGEVAADGSTTVAPLASTTYTMTVFGADNEDSCEAPVVVEIPEDTVPQCVSFTGSPLTVPYNGGTTTLAWETSNADTVTLSGFGAVAKTDSTDIFVDTPTTFTLNVADTDGDQNSCDVTIELEPEPQPLTCASDVDFTISDSSVDEGDSITLDWDASDRVESVSIDQGIGVVSNSGSRSQSVDNDTTYTLTATAGDETISCPVSVDVDTGGGGGGGGSSTPRCELEISDSRIDEGDEVTITWETSRATEVTLIDDRDNVIFTTDDFLNEDKEEWFDGSITVEPTRDTEYTLIAERGSRDRDCTVRVRLDDDGGNDNEDDDVVVIEERIDPLVAGISLSQTPYTGFEAGPILTMLFYLVLMTWAFYMAYLLVIKYELIGGESATATAQQQPKGIDAQAENYPNLFVKAVVPPQPTQMPVTASVAEAPTAPANLPTTSAPVIGYASAQAIEDTDTTDDEPETAALDAVTVLENKAHELRALVSSEALTHLLSVAKEDKQVAALECVVASAKVKYPTEDGWMVLNQSRMEALCQDCLGADMVKQNVHAPIGSGSLAEAILSGNITGAYALIGNRPMVAVADAASDLDAVYRARKGSATVMSEMLQTSASTLTDQQIHDAMIALTSALDGTYTSEEEAVKMAIMKAVKATS